MPSKLKKGAVIVATKHNGDYTDTTRTYKVLEKCKGGIVVKSLYYGTTHFFTSQYIKDSAFVDIWKIPLICKKVWKAFVQTTPTRTGDKTYMEGNQGYIYILYVTDSHIFGISPNGRFRILDCYRWNMNMFKECRAPKPDYYKYAKEMRKGNVVTSC